MRPEQKPARLAVLIIERDGEQHYLRHADDDSGAIVMFHSKTKAAAAAEFWRDGLGDEVQSVNVVAYPETRA